MDIFRVHREIMDDYANYIRSFVSISDPEIDARVKAHLDGGHLWPEPLLAFNPAFATAGSVDELARAGVLPQKVADAFCGYELFQHQLKALGRGAGVIREDRQ